ncbi:MAG: cytochrome b5-like heme/steroid binding domain-containing protein [Candidatus Falkowbacteria bacterium]
MTKIFALFACSTFLLAGCGAVPAVVPTTSPSAAPGSASSGSYTAADVAKHASAADCWQIIDAKVYNVTSYIDSHPGGPAIIKGCGVDASSLFHSVGKHASAATAAAMATYYIGTLK